VVGWTEGNRPWLGALLLGYYDPEGRLVYAGRHPFGYRACVDEVEPRPLPIGASVARRGRKSSAPDRPTTISVSVSKGRSCAASRSSSRIEILQRRLDLGENPRRDAGGKTAKKPGFHVLPSPIQDGSAIVALRSGLAKGLEAAPLGHREAGELPPDSSRERVSDARHASRPLARNWRENERFPGGVRSSVDA
jgi:hypothetical protein